MNTAVRPPVLNPRTVPVAGTDAHLPAVPADRLQASALRARFASPPEWTPEKRGDGGLFEGYERTDASVLVPLVERAAGLTVLLTQRTDHLRSHAGHVAFPGGRVDARDADAIDTALRETEEEVGLKPERVRLVGRLDTYVTRTGYRVTPLVGLIEPPLELAIDPEEVAEAFEVPLDFLLDPANRRRDSRIYQGIERHFWAMPFGRHYIWGATAGMLVNLAEVLGGPA
jgi:8-oxo-dGTP pyrophosphatase MutT (NUDIX family)